MFDTYKNNFINSILELENNDGLDIERYINSKNYTELWNCFFYDLLDTTLDIKEINFFNPIFKNKAFANYFKNNFNNIIYFEILDLQPFAVNYEEREKVIKSINRLYKDVLNINLIPDDVEYNLNSFHTKQAINLFLENY